MIPNSRVVTGVEFSNYFPVSRKGSINKFMSNIIFKRKTVFISIQVLLPGSLFRMKIFLQFRGKRF